MSDNPYESPQTAPERRRRNPAVVIAVLSLLAVPSAGIAGGVVCASGMTSDNGSFILAGFFGGLLMAIAIVLTAVQLMRRRWPAEFIKPNYVGGFLGFAIATPIALIAGFYLGANGVGLAYDPAPDYEGRLKFQGTEWFLIAGCVAFTIWSLGLWIGLRRQPSKASELKSK